MISLAITVCNEHQELETLLDYLQERALSPEYEIVIQIDQDNYTEEVLDVILDRGIKHWFFPLNKDFASFKNHLKEYCSGDYIFQIDADEYLSEELLLSLPEILEMNPEVELYAVPRINTVEGLTQEHINKWRWNVNEKGWVNFPDYQWRIWKNSSKIKWINKVHERLDGFGLYTNFPPLDQMCLYHPKEIKRQEKQNQFYSTL